MLNITSQSLAQNIQKQLDLYFTDFHRDQLEKKILEMISTVKQFITEILQVYPHLKDKLIGWQQNPSVLEEILCQLEEIMQKSTGEKSNVIDPLILQLKGVLSDREALFLSKTIGIADWNVNKDYLNKIISLLKDEVENRVLTCDEIITLLNLSPLNQCTSELGYYKEFARGIDEKGKSFTKIFYLLRSNEKSFFHKLDTNETWFWFGESPLSVFEIKNGQLIECILAESNQTVFVPNQTWFGAAVKCLKNPYLADDYAPFSLVTCHCVPAFTLSSYHDDILDDEDASLSLIDTYKTADSEMQSNIIELLIPRFQGKFKHRIHQ